MERSNTVERKGALWKLVSFIKQPLKAGNPLRSLTTVCARERYEGRKSFLTLEEVLSRLKNVRGRGQKYTACCPAHDDRHPSLSVAEGDRFPVLLYCHAGCSFDEIRRALGMGF